MGEQIPGYYVYDDQTWQLSKGWQSYNIPYYPLIYNLSGYPALYKKYGNEWSHDKCARAQIFSRDKHQVVDLATLKKQMRYNKWQTDPLSLKDSCRGISARCDLNPPWAENPLNAYSAFGGTDSKATTAALVGQRISHAVSGPTWDSQAVFHWSDEWAHVNHYGHPEVFAFDWVTMQPDA